MKGFLKILFKAYNILALIIGHIAIITGIVALCIYLHMKDMLYFVLIGIIVLLILIIVFNNIYYKLTGKKKTK